MLTDTVGFIRKLPHNLIQAFRSTLEEARYADILVHVVDSSNPDNKHQIQTVYETLDSLGVNGKPIITLLNKCDITDDNTIIKDEKADAAIRISAKTGEGLEAFLTKLQDIILESRCLISKLFPYTEHGILTEAYVPKSIYNKELD